MYIIKNALENLGRNKGRNILVAAIIFVIVATTVVALVINNTASAVIEDYSNRFGSQINISPNMEKVQAEAMRNAVDGKYTLAGAMPSIPPELLLSFANSDVLQNCEAHGMVFGNTVDITAWDQGNAVNDNCKIYGDYWQDFNEGTRSLMDDGISAFPSELNECIISQDLSELNGIKVGDTISITGRMQLEPPSDVDLSGYNDGDKFTYNGYEYNVRLALSGVRLYRAAPYNLTVTGIYYDLNDEYSYSGMSATPNLNRRNEILTSLDTLLAARAKNEDNIDLTVTYYLKNPDLLPEFESYVRAQGLSGLYDVSTDENAYNTVVKPVQGLKSISITFMVIVLVLGAIILILLTTIAIRERKYEIGVLRAMGMKKRKVSFGLWTELLVMTVACLIIGISVGSVVAQPVTNVLIEQQVEAIESSRGNTPTVGKLTPTPVSDAKPLSEMQISIDFLTVLEIIGIVLLLASLAGIISISKITKYEPIKILMERN